VHELVEAFLSHWPGAWRDDSDPAAHHEAHVLHLAVDKSQNLLGWQPTWNFEEAVKQTALWYQARHVRDGKDMLRTSKEQLQNYVQAARTAGAIWTPAS
jgi:CDP-glucose 4,6-dehydratase